MLMLATALIFFTRLPLWRWINVPSENFKRVIYYWPFAGWITSCAMVSTLLLASMIFPTSVAIVLTIISRVILTGALHEDGLADFMDGFGGGNTKEKTLTIMKDSHSGTYAILGLVLYFLLSYNIMLNIEVPILVILILIADPFCKMISSFITMLLPYARTIEASKIQTIYSQPTTQEIFISMFFGLLPFFTLIFFLPNYLYALALCVPFFTFFSVTQWMKYKIQGYTGDCAGALFLILELSLMLSFLAIYKCLTE